LRSPFGGQADGVELHPVGLLRQQFPPVLQLRVGRQEIVGADLVPQGLLRRGQRLLRGGWKSTARREEQRTESAHGKFWNEERELYPSRSRGGTEPGGAAGGPGPREVVAANGSERIEQLTGEKQAVGGGRRVLVVEEDDETRWALERLLKDYGYEVTGVGTAAEAMREAEGNTFDLAVVDLGLEDRQSVKLLEVLLGKRDCKSLGLSGHGAVADGEGFSKVLKKPVPVDQLMEAIKGLTE
jgi:CheY-like chemotaxis protein